MALDTMTLLEIERLFSSRRTQLRPTIASVKPTPSRAITGRQYTSVSGAVFYELEDLLLA